MMARPSRKEALYRAGCVALGVTIGHVSFGFMFGSAPDPSWLDAPLAALLSGYLCARVRQ